MGNPPFNQEKHGAHIGSTSNKELWLTFSLVSIDSLYDGGYLMFIHPQNWRGLGPKFRVLWDLMKKYQLHFLPFFGEKDGRNLFQASTKFDLYIFQKKLNFKKTMFIDMKGVSQHLNLKKYNFLPNYNIANINKILTDEDKGLDVIYDTSISHKNPETLV